MDQSLKELYVSRIINGVFRCKINEIFYIIKQPDRRVRHIAQQIYFDAIKDAELEGMYNDDELDKFLIENNLWSDQKEKDFKQIQLDIEELKVKLFQSIYKSEEKKVLRKMIFIAKENLLSLYQQKNAYNHLSCDGFASTMKMRYLVGKSLKYEDDTDVWKNDDFWKNTDPILEEATSIYIDNKISEKDFREIARTDPWRTIWSCRKSEGSLFGVPSVDLTDEQRSIIIWSSLYDNIYEHPNSPSEEIIQDDDMIDGWLILQRRERNKKQAKVEVEDFISNDKIKNSGEVFIIAQSKEDINRVDSLNDDQSKIIKKQRLKYLNEKGHIDESQMPDTKLELQMQANRGGKK
jgi:hypothetical protein